MLPELIAKAPLAADGAWGTQLQARGLPIGYCPDLWNLEHPELVEDVAHAYVEAGSQVIITNTFRANRIAMPEGNLAAINAAGVTISRRAAGDRAKVFASIGPSGRVLGAAEVTPGELVVAFEEQAKALAGAGADAILIETMADPEETKYAIAAAKSTGLPVVASMVFDSGRKGDRTMMGTTPEQAARELEAAGADVVGANCGRGIEGYVDVCRRMRAVTALPLWIKANAGMPELVGDVVFQRLQHITCCVSLHKVRNNCYIHR